MFSADVTFLMRCGRRLKPAQRDAPLRATVMIRESDRATNNAARNLIEVMLFEHWGKPQARSAGRLSDPVLLAHKGTGILISGNEIDSQFVDGEQLLFEHRQVWLVVPAAR